MKTNVSMIQPQHRVLSNQVDQKLGHCSSLKKHQAAKSTYDRRGFANLGVMHCAWTEAHMFPTYFLAARLRLTHIRPVGDCSLEAPSHVIVPPHSSIGEDCVVTGCALVFGVVPLCSHVWEQSLQ